jgi:heptosyltransferase-2
LSAPERHLQLAGVTVFFDRDGTLNPDPGYIGDPDDFELHAGVGVALERLSLAGARLIVLTNQSGLARGKFTVADLDAIHQKLRHLLAVHGVCLDAIYYCPHHPDDGCSCRKPGIGMAERAIADFALDRSRIFLVGDQSGDIEMAKRLGARSIFVTTGRDSNQALAEFAARRVTPDYIADSVGTATDWIIRTAPTVP